MKKGDHLKALGLKIAAAVFGFMVLVMALVLAIVGAVSDHTEPALVIAICVIGVFYGTFGVVMLVFGMRLQKYADKKDRYINILGNKTHVSLDGLAQTLKLPRAEVERDLEKLVSDKVFPQGYIDKAYGLFVMTDDPLKYDIEHHCHIKKCQNCGASTVVFDGELPICAFCGSRVDIKDWQERPD